MPQDFAYIHAKTCTVFVVYAFSAVWLLPGWAALRHGQAAGGFTGHKGGWFGGGAEETKRTPKMDFTDVACQLIGTAKK